MAGLLSNGAMDEHPRMMYRYDPKGIKIEGHHYATLIVLSPDEEYLALADGWCKSWVDSKAPAEPVAAAVVDAPVPSDRALLEAEANKRNLKFDGRTSDKKLAAMLEN